MDQYDFKFAVNEEATRSLRMLKIPKIIVRWGRIFVIAMVIFTLATAFAPWQQTSHGEGRVIAFSPNDRQQEINAPVDGIIKQWFVAEGSFVKKGELIVELSDNDPMIIQNLQNEKKAIHQKQRAAELAAETASINMDRQLKLFKEGLASRRDFEKARLEYTEYLADAASSTADLARIEVKLARQLSQKVVAPRDGTILKVLSGQGAQLVKAGTPLAILIPETASRVVELWVDGNDLPLMRLERKVRLQFEGWPAIQASGWPAIAVGTFGGQVAIIDSADNGMGQFRIVVKPDPDDPIVWPDQKFLRQGVQAMGWVLLDRVPVIYEIWRRFNGFPVNRPYQNVDLSQGVVKTSTQEKSKK